MKVLFISPLLPYPLYSGGQVRIYNLLRTLAKEHEVTLFSFVRDSQEKKYLSELSFLHKVHLVKRGSVWQLPYLFRAATSSLPLLLASYENNHMKKAITEELRSASYDCIHIEPFYVCPSLPKNIKIPVVVGEHNIEYTVYDTYVKQFPFVPLRPIMRLDVKKIQEQEERMWKKAKSITAVSPGDVSVIEAVTKKKVTLVPNGVDTKHFVFHKREFSESTPSFLFVGNFLWMPNMKAVERLLFDIWPNVIKGMPEAKLHIVGQKLSVALQEKAAAMHVTYLDHVEDIREMYESSDILVAPMTIAGGTKFKMLEALASGCLVITTKEGMEGIDAISGVHYYQANATLEFLTTIRQVLGDQKKSQKISVEGRKLVEEKYDWESIGSVLSHVWKEAV